MSLVNSMFSKYGNIHFLISIQLLLLLFIYFFCIYSCRKPWKKKQNYIRFHVYNVLFIVIACGFIAFMLSDCIIKMHNCSFHHKLSVAVKSVPLIASPFHASTIPMHILQWWIHVEMGTFFAPSSKREIPRIVLQRGPIQMFFFFYISFHSKSVTR